ncbi:hypothetical protein A2U01_0080922, partial [Trifolium medium]|nr:hypothetical protein [Trifolium medium]
TQVPDSVPSTPENNLVNNESQKTADKGNKGNTQPDESEGTKSRDEEEDSTADKTMAKDTAILDVDKTLEFAHRWKFVFYRRLALERELS